MEKFPILCTLSAVLVFLGATMGVAGVQTVKKNDLPFGLNSAEQLQSSAAIASVDAMALRQDVPAIGRLDLPYGGKWIRSAEGGLASRSVDAVEISGDLLVSF